VSRAPAGEGVGRPALPPLVEPGPPLGRAEVMRYSRHVIIPELGTLGQRRLANARVLCIGAGGLGSPVLIYLAAAGVGTLGIVDFDTVDESNLQRQIIHGQADIGRPKAQSAAETLASINPLLTVVCHEQRLAADNARTLFAGYDLIVDGTDNFATRYLVNDAAVLLGKPYVWGSIYRFDGQVSVFWADYGPCYRCLYPEPPPQGMVPSCAEGGVLGVLAGTIGSLQATEAIKVIAGIGQPLVGRLLTYDATVTRVRTLAIRKDPQCAVCGTSPTVRDLVDYEAFCGTLSEEAAAAARDRTISVADLTGILASGEPVALIDVREPAEHEIVAIPGSINIPKSAFFVGDAVRTLPQDRRIILYCKGGGRSAEVLAVLARNGIDSAVHVGGGVLAWVRQVEPHKPVY